MSTRPAPRPKPRRRESVALAAGVVLLLGLSVPVGANHVQTGSGKSVAFDHVGGNEWWVEVAVTGQDSGQVSKIEAQDTDGPWLPLAKRSWGPYAASFHLEPGHQVRFRASWAGGAQVVSCWFDHPGGVERCSASPPPPPPPPPPGSFDAAFTGVRGNEWWVQATVATNGAVLAKVEATADGGASWKTLAKQSWGGWAASIHLVQGSTVQLRATAASGATDLSSCHRWVPPSGQDAAVVACGTGPPPPPPPPPPPSAFSATFTGVKGNEWWVQANVAANQPLAGVDASADCGGTWHALAKQSWGGWAASFYIPSGSKVMLRARSSTEETGTSGAYLWPSASPAPACEAPAPTVPPSDLAFHLEPVASGFTSPVFVGNAGDGTDRMFVLEKAGVVKVRHAGSGTSTVFLDLRAKVSAYRDAGLLGLAFHPAFEDNGRLFVAYSDLDGHLEFVEFHADGDVADPASERLVLKVEQVPGEIHHAGMLAFGPDGLLYASTGDSAPGGDPERSAQRVDNLLGKILRIDVDGDEPYEVPADNPFVGVDGRDEIWAYGLRNPWRFSFDRGTGDLWIGDVGQDRFEEVDRQPAAFAGGANYGWSLWEGWERYWTDGVAADYVPPVAVYGHDPPCSVTGGYVYRGAAQPWLDGSYLFGDYCTGLVWTLDPDGGGWDMRVALDSSLRITSFGEDEAGEVYVVDYGGAVYRLVAGAPGP